MNRYLGSGVRRNGRSLSPKNASYMKSAQHRPADSEVQLALRQRSLDGRVTQRRSRCQLARPSIDTLMPRRTPIPRAFFLVSAANFLSFLNLAFFFLMPLWVHSKG